MLSDRLHGTEPQADQKHLPRIPEEIKSAGVPHRNVVGSLTFVVTNSPIYYLYCWQAAILI